MISQNQNLFSRLDVFNILGFSDISKANKFQIVGNKLLPPFNTIDGMGDKAAEAVELAAKDGPYLSKDDFRQRTKISKTVIDLMDSMGLFGDLPESNQLSLFDFAV